MDEQLKYGDVVVKMGETDKWVVMAFTSRGNAVIDHPDKPNKFNTTGSELLSCSWGRCISSADPGYVKVGKWDFSSNCEIDDERVQEE